MSNHSFLGSSSTENTSIENQVLFARIQRLVATERRIGIEILECLYQIELRKAYAELRYEGLYTYCVKELGFSDSQAFQRIQAMRALREMPELKEGIESGALSVSSVAKVQTHFRRERKSGAARPKTEKLELFRIMENRTSREVDAKLAEVRGEPPTLRLVVEMDAELAGLWQAVRDRAAHRSGGSDAEAMKIVSREWLERNDPGRESARGLKDTRRPEKKSSERKSRVIGAPTAAVPKEMKVDEGTRFQANTRAVANTETHVTTSAQADTSRRAVPSLIKVVDRRRRFVPAALKREIWRRDGGKCTRCGSRHALEIDHRRPFAMGGSTNFGNLRLLCRSCNQFVAVRAFGVEKCTQKSTSV